MSTDTAAAPEALSPEARLAELEAKHTEMSDAYLRAKAEADNIRKRAQADIANAHKYALESFAGELLSVRDALSRRHFVPCRHRNALPAPGLAAPGG